MFHKFTNFIQQAVETFSPNVSPQEEFVFHWKSVTSYFVDTRVHVARIEETSLREHLMSMLKILQEEESHLGETGTTGVCLEYLLQHKLLETLYTLGRTDYPPGMKQIVLSFFTKLLARISHPLLPHINVHRAVQRLVKVCGETKASPTEKEEIEFLCTVCAKIKVDPYMVNFFIKVPKPSTRGDHVENHTHSTPMFSLVNALLCLSSSEDARVCVKACEGLMLCASLPEQSAVTTLLHHTQFCQTLAGNLLRLYQRLPKLINPSDVEHLEAKWGFNDVIARHEAQGLGGKSLVISFLSWLDYCDQLIAVANPQVAELLAREIHKTLLSGQVLQDLLQISESNAIVTTAYVTRCLHTICSQALLREFSYFLLGPDRNTEYFTSSVHPLKKRLLERCNHISEEVSIITLKLFDTLLQKEDEHIFHSLLLRNMLGRSYLRESPSPTGDFFSSLPAYESNQGKNQETNSFTYEVGFENNQQEDQAIYCFSALTAHECNQQEDHEKDCVSLKHVHGKDKPLSWKAVSSIEVPPGKEGKQLSATFKLSPSAFNDSAPTGSKDNTSDFITDKSIDNSEVASNQLSQGSVEILASKKDGISLEKTYIYNTEHASLFMEASKTEGSSPDTWSDASTLSDMSSEVTSPKFVRTDVHKAVNSFLSLLPETMKSSQHTDSGYDMYLRDAHMQFAIQDSISRNWGWPRDPVVLADHVMESFYEGSFLHMLLDKLLHMLDQSYSINLLLTALIAKVALLPHPNLHEYLLDPFLPTVEETRTLYSVLVKVTNEIKQRQKSESSFRTKVLMARQQLAGLSLHGLRTVKSRLVWTWLEDQSQTEAVIVLEEFCKELSAITFVKHHAAVTRL